MTPEQADEVISLLGDMSLAQQDVISQLTAINSRLDESSFVTTYSYSGTVFAGDWRVRREVTSADITSWLVWLPLVGIVLGLVILRAFRGKL